MAFEVPFGKKARIPFSFKDASGNAAKVDGLPVITTTLGTVVEVVSDGSDGFSALLDIAGVGLATVTGTADVDLGEGVKELAFSLGEFSGLASPEAESVVVGTPTTE